MAIRDRSPLGAGSMMLTVFGLGTVGFVSATVPAQVIFDEPVFFAIPDETPPLLIREYYSSLVTGDFDADGHIDIAVTSSRCRDDYEAFDGITIFFNDGTGAFPEPVKIPLTNQPRMVCAGDFDNDGDTDLAIAGRVGREEGSVIVLMNNGDGSFGEETVYPLERPADTIAVGDMDGANGPDFIVGLSHYVRYGNAWGALYELRNQGDGTFAEGSTFIFETTEPDIARGLALGDLDDDGDLDVASTFADLADGESYLYYGAWSNRMHVLANPSGPLDSFTFPNNGSYYQDIRTAKQILMNDINQDGKLEIIAYHGETSAWGSPRWSEFSELFFFSYDPGGGGLDLVHSVPSEHIGFGGRMMIGDADGDGDLDVLVTSGKMMPWYERPGGEFRLTLIRNDGGHFAVEELAQHDQYLFPEGAALVDVDGDGRLDIVSSILEPEMGILVMRNITEFIGPTLMAGDLARGESTTFTVTDANPNELIYVLYGFGEPGNSRGIRPFGGINLDIIEPIQLVGSARADDTGTMTLSRTIPYAAPLSNITLQAVARRGVGGADSVKTNFLLRRIRE